jgi:hypothetical protein
LLEIGNNVRIGIECALIGSGEVPESEEVELSSVVVVPLIRERDDQPQAVSMRPDQYGNFPGLLIGRY